MEKNSIVMADERVKSVVQQPCSQLGEDRVLATTKKTVDESKSDCPPFQLNLIQRRFADDSFLFNSPPLPQKRPENYQETHAFKIFEVAFGLVEYHGRLGIVIGRVTECYKNREKDGILIYVLSTSWEMPKDYHLPSLLLFHYHEDAVYVLQNEIVEHERNDVERYFKPSASREKALQLEDNLAISYAERYKNKSIPTARMKRVPIPGLVALGLPSYRLVSCKVPPNVETQARKSLQYHTRHHHPNTAVINANQTVFAWDAIASSKNIITDKTCYDPMFHRDFKMTRDQFRRYTMLRRLLYYSVENVCLFALSRYPTNHQVDVVHLQSQISSILNYYYADAPPQDRRFLTMAHFGIANESNQPSATSTHTCSFCSRKHNSRQSLRDHVKHIHLLVYTQWSCPKCNKTFSQPSMWRLHMLQCDPQIGFLLLLNISPQIIDAFADFYASKSSNSNQELIYQPGLPSYSNKGIVVVDSFRNTLEDWPIHVNDDIACPKRVKRVKKRACNKKPYEESSTSNDDEDFEHNNNNNNNSAAVFIRNSRGIIKVEQKTTKTFDPITVKIRKKRNLRNKCISNRLSNCKVKKHVIPNATLQ